MSDQDATARRAELEDAVTAAEEDQRQIRSLARAAHERVAAVRERLAARPREEFHDDGSAKPKTEAARLHRERQVAESPPVSWERRQQDATAKITHAKRAVDRFTSDNIEQLVLDLKPARDADDALIVAKLNELDAMLVDRVSFAQKVGNLLAPVPGLNAVSEIPSADDITELRKTIRNFLARRAPANPAGVHLRP